MSAAFLIVLNTHSSSNSDTDVSEGAWGKNKLIESSEKRSHEGVGLGDVNLTLVVHVEFSPGSWEELSHVCLHLGLRNLLGNKKDLSTSFLASILVENLGTSELSSSIGDSSGVVVEDVVHNVILISAEVLR